MRLTRAIGWSLLAACAWTHPAEAAQKLVVPVRGQSLTLTVYRPAVPPRGTILMGSGDAGWVGLAVTMAGFLSDQGYLVIGINVRQYLSSFTNGPQHLGLQDPGADYRALSGALARQGLLIHPVCLSGVSEGAALSILAAADPKNHSWIDAVVAMGVPATAELAWRWTDAAAWITKRDLDEPSFAPHQYAAAVSPIPLCMIQSSHDEYATDADRARLLAAARDPKTMMLIAAANHRFSDRHDELCRQFLAAIAWTNAVRRIAHE